MLSILLHRQILSSVTPVRSPVKMRYLASSCAKQPIALQVSHRKTVVVEVLKCRC